MYWVLRIRDEHRIASSQGGEHQVGEALLGTNRDDRFMVRIDERPVTLLVPMGNGPPQARNAPGSGVAVGIRALGHIGELGDDVRRGGPVGVAHAQVDDVLAAPARRQLQFGGDIEDIGRQPIDAREAAPPGRKISHVSYLTSAPGTVRATQAALAAPPG